MSALTLVMVGTQNAKDNRQMQKHNNPAALSQSTLKYKAML